MTILFPISGINALLPIHTIIGDCVKKLFHSLTPLTFLFILVSGSCYILAVCTMYMYIMTVS